MNPLYNQLNPQGIPQMNPQMGNILNQFQQFRSTFQGNPQQMVQQLLNSGKVTQAQYDNAVRIANQFRQFIK